MLLQIDDVKEKEYKIRAILLLTKRTAVIDRLPTLSLITIMLLFSQIKMSTIFVFFFFFNVLFHGPLEQVAILFALKEKYFKREI